MSLKPAQMSIGRFKFCVPDLTIIMESMFTLTDVLYTFISPGIIFPSEVSWPLLKRLSGEKKLPLQGRQTDWQETERLWPHPGRILWNPLQTVQCKFWGQTSSQMHHTACIICFEVFKKAKHFLPLGQQGMILRDISKIPFWQTLLHGEKFTGLCEPTR